MNHNRFSERISESILQLNNYSQQCLLDLSDMRQQMYTFLEKISELQMTVT